MEAVLALLAEMARRLVAMLRPEPGAPDVPRLAIAEVRGVPYWRRFLAWLRRRRLVRLDATVVIPIPEHAGGGTVEIDALPPSAGIPRPDPSAVRCPPHRYEIGAKACSLCGEPWQTWLNFRPRRDPLRPLGIGRPEATKVPGAGARTKR